MDATTANELSQGEEEWKRKCENIIRTKYWPLQHNKENGRDLEEFAFYLVRNLVKGDLRETCDTYRHEVQSYCLNALNEFANARSAVRSAVENLQRCVLENVAPVAIHLETHKSLLNRWSSILTQGLNGHLLDIEEKNKEKTGKPIENNSQDTGENGSEDSGHTTYEVALNKYAQISTPRQLPEETPVKSLEESPEVNKIIGVFEQLLVSADGDSLLKTFIESTHSFDKNDWMKAFKGLAEFQLTGEEFRRFTNAYQFCLEEIPILGSEKSIPKKLPKLRRIFSGDLITLDMEGKKVSKAASRRAK